MDDNDNFFVFGEFIYNKIVFENILFGIIILRVIVIDVDSGLNGELEYYIS